MKCFLAGSKELSVKVLDELVTQGHTVVGILCRDSEPGMKVWHEVLKHRSLKNRALELNIKVFEGININSEELLSFLTEANLDVLISVFWGEILKETILTLPRLGCINLHTAYLPQNRGSFPIPWAIIDGLTHTGLTIHRMLPGVDNGPIISQVKVDISDIDTACTLYTKVTNAGAKLFKETLPEIAKNTFSLKPQDEKKATYHPRGYPFAGQINPYWPIEKKMRFKRALNFPPFPAETTEPNPIMQGFNSPALRVMIGMDCDRPRGSFISSESGKDIANRKLNSLNIISDTLENLKIKRTFFICGSFLESMNYHFGESKMRNAFCVKSNLVEIADHTYSHDVLKNIKTRPDKIPMNSSVFRKEFILNTKLFYDILDIGGRRGLRTPLGHYSGLSGEFKMLDTLKSVNIPYVSSDLRCSSDSLNPKLFLEDGTPRQPYRYENGLLEIPSMGWQDTVFSGTTRTKLFEKPPESYEQIFDYYEKLFLEANKIVAIKKRDYFLGLVIHPLDVSYYDTKNTFFYDLSQLLDKFSGSFCTYLDVANHYSCID